MGGDEQLRALKEEYLKHTATRIDKKPVHGRKPAEPHPAWQALMDMCRELGYGEIERLKIQDGLPVFVEKITEKIKLT